MWVWIIGVAVAALAVLGLWLDRRSHGRRTGEPYEQHMDLPDARSYFSRGPTGLGGGGA